MKVPSFVSRTVRNEHVVRVYATFGAIMYRIIPVVIFGLLFMQVAVMIDQHHYQTAPATDFLNYTDFTVQNARVGEDVYFKVCRDHVSSIHFDGNINIFIIANPDQKNEQRIKVYGRDIAGTIDNDCENKVIRASDFKHDAGTYEMTFCVQFKVKYGYEKQLCKTSNRYRIYPQPSDLESQIKSLQQQLDNANAELKDTSGDINAPQDQSLNVTPQKPGTSDSTPTSGTQNAPAAGNTAPTGGGQSGTGVQPPTCALNVAGIGVACGNDGILRL